MENESVSVVIFNVDRTRVLLVKRRDIPVWVLPGGGIDPLESPENAAIREILEETGFHVSIKRKIADYQPVNRLTKRTHFFECAITSGQATTNSESQAIQFFPLNDLPILPPPYKSWINDALNPQKEIIRKKIEGVSYFILIKLLLQHPILVSRYLLTKIGIHLNSKN